jgi:hypothetical protein
VGKLGKFTKDLGKELNASHSLATDAGAGQSPWHAAARHRAVQEGRIQFLPRNAIIGSIRPGCAPAAYL